jgi:DNA topoisomerase-2
MEEMWVYNSETDSFSLQSIRFNPGLFNIIRELGSNIIDNKWRSESTDPPSQMKTVQIILDPETGRITFMNDGYCIPVEKQTYVHTDHRTQKNISEVMYPAELFFGEMLAGTNFEDDDVPRKTSGKNGIGAKAANVFSVEFEVDHADGKKRFYQKYVENGKRTDYQITSLKKKGYTKISFIPDYHRFGYEGLDDDLIGVIKYYAYEISAMLKGIPVEFKVLGEEEETHKIVVKDMIKWAKMHYPSAKNFIHLKNKNGDEMVMIERDDPPESDEIDNIAHRSYVNGILMKDGGTHVDVWRDAIFTKLIKTFNGRKVKEPLPKASAKNIYPYFLMILRCEIDRPEFFSQTKDKFRSFQLPKGYDPDKWLEYTKAQLAPESPNQEQLNKMMKWDFISLLEEKLLAKADKALSKKENSRRLAMGDKLKDAGWAGTKQRDKAILCITEGLSAKTLAVRGMAVMDDGHDRFGAYAIRGKFLNVTNATKAKINQNEEVQSLKKVLGLKTGVDYMKDENYKDLRYGGGVLLMTDADDDGIHIRGLLLNFFWKMFPSLMQRNYVGTSVIPNSFTSNMRSLSTPVVKVNVKTTKGVTEKVFYTNQDFRNWYANTENAKSIVSTKKHPGIKYFKGLGSADAKEAADFFSKQITMAYYIDGEEDNYMTLGFSDKSSHQRKEWITKDMVPANSDEIDVDDVPTTVVQYQGNISVGHFVDKQLVIYHRMVLRRALPSLWDGFTESMRKIIYGLFLRNFQGPKNIEILGAAVKEVAHYEHAIASLYKTMQNMAKGFVGSNNIPLLTNDSEMGSRIGGLSANSDECAPRYSLTQLEEVTRSIFPQVDNELCKHRYESNDKVEYVHYIPAIPMVLVNGTKSIGTGFSSTIPSYNPTDIVNWIKLWLTDPDKLDELEYLTPWYRNFKGKITLIYDDNNIPIKWESRGILEKGPEKDWWHIRELPIDLWGNKMAEELEYLQSGQPVKGSKKKPTKNTYLLDFKDLCSANTIHYMIKPRKEYIPDIDTKGNLTMLKSTHSLTNMVLIDENDYPKRYNTAEEILEEFCERRIVFYDKRKTYLLDSLHKKYKVESNRYKFVKAVVDGRLKLNQEDTQLESDMMSLKLAKMSTGETREPSYDYLLSMQMRSMTKKKLEELQKLIDNINKDITILQGKKAKDLWMEDLDNFEKEYARFLKTRIEEVVKK